MDFNLIIDAWIPVKRMSGNTSVICPADITSSIEIDPNVSFNWGRPDFDGATYEFMVGLLTTSMLCRNEDRWIQFWRQPPPPQVLQEHLEWLAAYFNVFGDEARFMQDMDPNVEKEKERPASNLLIDAPGAQTLRNNADWFVPRDRVNVMSPAAAAIALYALQSFAPTGGAGHRTSLRGGGPLTTMVVTQSKGLSDIWDRLWPNVESMKQLKDRGDADGSDLPDVFPWLAHTRTSSPKQGGVGTGPDDMDPLQVYWGMPRRIRLKIRENPDHLPCDITGNVGKYIVPGFFTKNYGVNYTEGHIHPLTPYYRTKADGPMMPVHVQPAGISYRMWPGAVLAIEKRQPAQVVDFFLRERAQHVAAHGRPRLYGFGYDMDNAKARAWHEGEMPLFVQWADNPERTAAVEEFMLRAATAAQTVARVSVRSVRYGLNAQGGDLSYIGDQFFRQSEEAFYEAIAEFQSLLVRRNNQPNEELMQEACAAWVVTLSGQAYALYDKRVPEDQAAPPHVASRRARTRHFLGRTLAGYGEEGKELFENTLGIPAPEEERDEQKAA